VRALFEFEGKPLLFDHPRRVILCHDPDDLHSCFDALERAIADGHHAAGYLSYEAGYAFEPALRHLKGGGFPLMCMGIFDEPRRERSPSGPWAFKISGLTTSIPQDVYTHDIAWIHDHIRDGDVYQITYCLKHLFSFRGSAHDLYRRLLRSQPVPYPAYIETDRHRILSLSPEMFIQKTGTRVMTKPMKGSWPRGDLYNDLFGGFLLKFDTKNRAENVMIADLLRNDLGRIGTGVGVPSLFEVARYKTIFQMTSTVSAVVPVDIPFFDLFRAIFPSGSVTGAPKVKAMEIIRDLERSPRKVYTGAIGWITPQRDLFFNVPIRTLLIEGDKGEMGVGGGIVWDSTAQGEWDEGLWKSRFLREAAILVQVPEVP
jgi:para-aminobenzoate synthetase/4-amino-4-deoxychorismate lyase